MPHADLVTLVEAMSRARVLCVGDAMIDHYVSGRVERISPEAPVPVLQDRKRRAHASAAPATCCAISMRSASRRASSRLTGGDPAGRDLTRMVAELGIAEAHVLAERDRVTTVKTRFIADTQQLLRADRERVMPLSPDIARRPAGAGARGARRITGS